MSAVEFSVEVHDWQHFQTLAGLSQKAGVPERLLRRLVLKELADNALDTAGAGDVRIYQPEPNRYIVEDTGPGMDGGAEAIARYFSINRPMVSSKLWRTAKRGALGNGLRVVVGALYASGGGRLTVTTKGRRYEVRPQSDGKSLVSETRDALNSPGTMIEISFGPHVPEDPDGEPLLWAFEALHMRGEDTSAVKPSVWTHDGDSFFTLTRGAPPDCSVRQFITAFDGCSGAKAGAIAGPLLACTCADVTPREAAELLKRARAATKMINPDRLGKIGEAVLRSHRYARVTGTTTLGIHEPKPQVPFVVEAWAKTNDDHNCIRIFVNRTPIAAPMKLIRVRDKRLVIWGCGLNHYLANTPKSGGWEIVVNIMTPFMPITSDGKTPELSRFYSGLDEAIGKAIRRAKHPKAEREGKPTQKDAVLERISEAIAKATGNGRYRAPQRNVYYVMREILMQDYEMDLQWKWFCGIVLEYEALYGDIPEIYRDVRGVFRHPHGDGGDTPLGTLTVESYKRPAWNYNKIVYIEKQGHYDAIAADQLDKKHDFMLMTAKGFSGKAAKDLIDKIAAHGEPVLVMCVHDADASGTLIYETLQEATRARGARNVTIVNLGLDPWEAVEMGLPVEKATTKCRRDDDEDGGSDDRRKGCAQYVRDRETGARDENGHWCSWEEWLQNYRIELNAMTMPQFMAWFEKKLVEAIADWNMPQKVIPPQHVIDAEARQKLGTRLRDQIAARILNEAKFEEQVAAAMEKAEVDATPDGAGDWLRVNEKKSWRDYIDARVQKAIGADDDEADAEDDEDAEGREGEGGDEGERD